MGWTSKVSKVLHRAPETNLFFDPALIQLSTPGKPWALGIRTPQRCHPQSPTTLWCASQSTASWHPWRPGIRQEMSGNWPSLRSLLRVHLFTDVYITSLFCSGLVNHQKAVADQVDQLSFGYFRMCVCDAPSQYVFLDSVPWTCPLSEYSGLGSACSSPCPPGIAAEY